MRARASLTLLACCGAALASQPETGNQPQPAAPPSTTQAAPQTVPTAPTLACWPEPERGAYMAYEQSLFSTPTRDSLLRAHQLLASEPHIAGTPGDERVIRAIEAEFKEIGRGVEGWTVEVDEFWAYLPSPVAAELEIVSPEAKPLELRERPVASDPAADAATGAFAWLGYSGSGEATGEIVYANYGTKQDFAKLKELGVDLKGKIVLCRYGGNYRGFKVKFAEAAGAAGVLIYTDPADAGFTKGDVYPAGGWANDCCIQRGSLLAMKYQGDPLTPGVPATKDAKRLDPAEVGLPTIPAQPIGYGAATEILSRMTGEPLPESLKAWIGGAKAVYRLTGGPGLKVRLKVEQKREIVRSASITATLRGAGPDQAEIDRKVIIGCHHDAWNNGAADPTCGTITMLESARAFAEQARAGKRPRRTVVFAAWGAEEMGLIGSTEYVEKRRADLFRSGVGYLNLDMASMGVRFGASSSPELKTLIADVARVVPQARDESKSVFDEWFARSPATSLGDGPGEPAIGDVGGGSDHVPFLMHAGVPSASLSCYGSQGNSYHSAYDTLPWYWKTVGDDYQPALMITRMATGVASRLAESPIIPYCSTRAIAEAAGHLRTLKPLAVAAGLNTSPGYDQLTTETAGAIEIMRAFMDPWRPTPFDRLAARSAGNRAAADRALAELNAQLLTFSRIWIRDAGIPGRAWFKNWYVATDADSGYDNWILPGFRKAIDEKDQAAFDAAVTVYAEILNP